MRIKEEESIQISLKHLFNLSKSVAVYTENNNKYKCIQSEAVFISNRNESGRSGPLGNLIGNHYNRMGRYPGEPDIQILYTHKLDIPSVAYIELKTPHRYAETGIFKTGQYKGQAKPSVNIHSLEDSQIRFRDEVCNPLNIPWTVVCDETGFFEFLCTIGVMKLVEKGDRGCERKVPSSANCESIRIL